MASTHTDYSSSKMHITFKTADGAVCKQTEVYAWEPLLWSQCRLTKQLGYPVTLSLGPDARAVSLNPYHSFGEVRCNEIYAKESVYVRRLKDSVWWKVFKLASPNNILRKHALKLDVSVYSSVTRTVVSTDLVYASGCKDLLFSVSCADQADDAPWSVSIKPHDFQLMDCITGCGDVQGKLFIDMYVDGPPSQELLEEIAAYMNKYVERYRLMDSVYTWLRIHDDATEEVYYCAYW